MKLQKTDMPVLFAGKNTTIVDGTLNDLKGTGVTLSSNAIKLGDTIEFPSDKNDVLVQIQEFNQNRGGLVGVLRNGEPSWLRISSLSRRDKDMKTVCDLSETLSKMPNDSDRVTFLLGKKISCQESKTVKTYKFVNNVRTDELQDTDFPVITIVS